MQNDKVSKFVAAITKEADERRARIMAEAEEYIAAELKKAEDEALEEIYGLIRRKAAAVRAAAARETAAKRRELRRRLHAEREALMRRVFERAEEELRAFAAGKDYEDFLLRSCKRAKERFGTDAFTVSLRESDADLIANLRRELPGSDFECDSQIRIGGLKFHPKDRNVAADDTLDARLLRERERFLETAELRIDF